MSAFRQAGCDVIELSGARRLMCYAARYTDAPPIPPFILPLCCL